MDYTLQTLEELGDDPIDLAVWMINENFLHSIQECRHCHAAVHLERFNENADGVVWRCARRGCRWYRGVRENSFLANSNLSLRIQMKLIISFAADATAKSTALHEVGLSRKTVVNFFIACRRNYQAAVLADPIDFWRWWRI